MWKWLLMNARRWVEAWASPNMIGICGCGQLILNLFVKRIKKSEEKKIVF
jgi:hypothetical protein